MPYTRTTARNYYIMIYLTLLYLICPPVPNPQAIINAELNRLLEVDPLDWDNITLDGHERALS